MFEEHLLWDLRYLPKLNFAETTLLKQEVFFSENKLDINKIPWIWYNTLKH